MKNLDLLVTTKTLDKIKEINKLLRDFQCKLSRLLSIDAAIQERYFRDRYKLLDLYENLDILKSGFFGLKFIPTELVDKILSDNKTLETFKTFECELRALDNYYKDMYSRSLQRTWVKNCK